MKDVLGREVLLNDILAHVVRHGANMHWSKKYVVQVGEDHLVVRDVMGMQSKIRRHFVVIPGETMYES